MATPGSFPPGEDDTANDRKDQSLPPPNPQLTPNRQGLSNDIYTRLSTLQGNKRVPDPKKPGQVLSKSSRFARDTEIAGRSTSDDEYPDLTPNLPPPTRRVGSDPQSPFSVANSELLDPFPQLNNDSTRYSVDASHQEIDGEHSLVDLDQPLVKTLMTTMSHIIANEMATLSQKLGGRIDQVQESQTRTEQSCSQFNETVPDMLNQQHLQIVKTIRDEYDPRISEISQKIEDHLVEAKDTR
ncbi:hypothetical protein QBC35DRAFT_457345, partial [Podospora australis]